MVQSLYGCGDRDDRGVRDVEEEGMLHELLASSTDTKLCRLRTAGHRSQLGLKLTDSTPASCFAYSKRKCH